MFDSFTISFFCSVFFLICFIAIQIIRRDLNHREDALSLCAKGRAGFILTLGFLAITLAQFILAIKIFELFSKVAGVIFLIAAMGALLTSVFKIDIDGQKSMFGRLHNLGARLEFIFFTISLLLLGSNFNDGYAFFTFFIPSIIILFITMLLGVSSLFNKYYFGLIERFNVLAIAIWMAYFSYTQLWI